MAGDEWQVSHYLSVLSAQQSKRSRTAKAGTEAGKRRRLIASMLYGVKASDPLIYISVAVLLRSYFKTLRKTIRVGRRHRRRRPRQKPTRVIADKAYGSDALRTQLRRGVVLIAPHRSNRYRTAPQDGRVLRRYKKRWIVERSIVWLGNFRRLVVRYDRLLAIYQAFVHIAIPDMQRLEFTGNKLHPTQKTVMSLLPIVQAYSLPGDTILDCFCGSASTCAAALLTDRKYIGIELDNEYFTQAVARMERVKERIAAKKRSSQVLIPTSR